MLYEGHLTGKDFKFAIIVSRFNELISQKLQDGAMDALIRHGIKEEDIDIFKVPGSFEIPYLCKKIAEKKKHDAIVTLGTVIRGETPHFEYVAAEVSKGIANVSLQYDVPITFGIVTADTVEQAIDRAGLKHGNKGFEVAKTAIEMVNLVKKI